MPHFPRQQSVREQPPVRMAEESLLTKIQAEMRFTSQSLNKLMVCCNRQQEGLNLFKKNLWDLCLRDYLCIHKGRVQHLRCCIRSLHHYTAVCNIKYQEAFNKTTEVDNTQGPNSSPSVHFVVSYLLPLALHQNQNITALTYSLSQAADILT